MSKLIIYFYTQNAQFYRYKKPIGPCASFCRRIKASCKPIMESFQYSWPDYLNCSQYLKSNKRGNMCVDPEEDFWKNSNKTKEKNKPPKIICK